MSCSKRTSVLPVKCEEGKNLCLIGSAEVQIKTTKGDIVVKLNGDSSPVTAGNFADLIQRNAYQGTYFHRVIKEPIPFIIQGGDPTTKLPSTPKEKYGTGSFIDPINGEIRSIPLELKLRNEDHPRYGQLINNPRELLQLQLIHKRGSIAMARSQDPNSASSQFYIALRAIPELDGRYSVFGRVIKGMEVLDKISSSDKILKTKILFK